MPDNLYRRGSIWWFRRQVGGREIRRSLRTASRAEAIKRRAKIADDIGHQQVYGEARHSWREAVVEWASQTEVAPATRRRYLVSLAQIKPVLSELFIDEISARTIAKIGRRAAISNATRRRDITAVSVVLRWCVGQGWIESNPARNWDRGVIKERRGPIRLPELRDIESVVAAAPPSLARMIRFAQYTGMRQEEIASLMHVQVDSRRAAATLIKTKTNRPRAVPLDERALGTYAGTPQRLGCPYVFWHEPGSRYLNVATRFAKIVRAAQAKARKENRPVPQHFRFHDLRHWFAVDYLRRGGSIYRLQQILGHSSIRTTEIYLDYLTPEEQDVSKQIA